MDSLINAAARALASGDPLGALNRIALRGDAPALALRGIAMAQLGDFERARTLVRNAARAFGAREAVARARCVLAEAEIAFAARDLAWSQAAFDAAKLTLEKHGDVINVAHARCVEVRRWLLLGRIEEAEHGLAALDDTSLPSGLQAACALLRAGIAMRRIDTQTARAALSKAQLAARDARIPALRAEVESAARLLDLPVARRTTRDGEQALSLEDVETLFASQAFVVDACRHAVRQEGAIVPLATRPVLFKLVRALAEAWPEDVSRELLVARAFRARRVDESYRARLRVEIGRLRNLLRKLAGIEATSRGFRLEPVQAQDVVLLERPVEENHAEVLALLADGESWSSSALALALDVSQRSVQRALDTLASNGKVQSFGRGRARRWLAPSLPGLAPTLLLPGTLPID